MLAEPGWVIPAGRFERRYAALAVSTERRGDREYFRALHAQIGDGGAEAMFYDLREMELGDWHPREIPDALLRNPALQEQQGHTLPPWEQWYVMLLHNRKVPGALAKRPNTAFTSSLLENARERVPRLRWEGEVALRAISWLIRKGSGSLATSTARATQTAETAISSLIYFAPGRRQKQKSLDRAWRPVGTESRQDKSCVAVSSHAPDENWTIKPYLEL